MRLSAAVAGSAGGEVCKDSVPESLRARWNGRRPDRFRPMGFLRPFGRVWFGAGPGGPGGGGILAFDALTPAAAFLNISVSTLTTDLAGGKTLAQEATAKGKTAATT